MSDKPAQHVVNVSIVYALIMNKKPTVRKYSNYMYYPPSAAKLIRLLGELSSIMVARIVSNGGRGGG